MANGNGHSNVGIVTGTVTYSDTKIDGPGAEWSINVEATPSVSLNALLSRGLSHVLGNEASSKVITRLRKDAVAAWKAENVGKDLDVVTKEAIEGSVKFDRASPTHLSVQFEVRQSMLDAIAAGTLGEGRESGPRLSPFEAEVQAIVHREVLAMVKNENIAGATAHKGRKLPEDDAEFNILGTIATFGELKVRYAAGKHKARIEKEAQAKLDALARSADKLAKAAGEAQSSADIGF